MVIGRKYLSQLGIVFCFYDHHPTQVRFKPMTLNTIEVGRAKILLQKIFDQLRSEEMYVRFLLIWLLNWTIYSWIKKSKQFSSELFHILEFAAVAGDTLQNWPCPPPLQSIWTPSTILISFTETIFIFICFIKTLFIFHLLAPSGALIAIPTYYWPTSTTSTPLFQITPVLNTGLSLSEPLQLYKGYNAI